MKQHRTCKAPSARLLAILGLGLIAGMPAWAAAPPVPNGYSDMVKIGESGSAGDYLAVRDTKFEKGWLSRLSCGPTGFVEQAIKVKDWSELIPKCERADPGDVEAICKLPGRDEYLAMESGSEKEPPSRILRFSVEKNEATVLAVYPGPKLRRPDKKDNFEGLACAAADGRVLLIFGERGGRGPGKKFPEGRLFWAWLDLAAKSESAIDFSAGPATGLPVTAPGAWPPGDLHRDISALYLDGESNLWAAATWDRDDKTKIGVFRSVIYKVATVDPANEQAPIRLAPAGGQPSWILDGFKVEALAAPCDPDAALAIGTEDESLDGVVRLLFPPVN